jgi:hypothetical protein
MQRKKTFPPEPDTQPDGRRVSGRAPKSKRAASEAVTVPPPRAAATSDSKGKTSRPQARKASSGTGDKHDKRDKGGRSTGEAGATVDEVTADLSRDPRREQDE